MRLTFPSHLAALLSLLVLLSLHPAAAQSVHQSATPRRRSPMPGPTSPAAEQMTDPDLLVLLAQRNIALRSAEIDTWSAANVGLVSRSPDSPDTHEAALTRSRRRKIHGLNHGADQLPLTNAERMRLGLPLKPPALKPARKAEAAESSKALADDEYLVETEYADADDGEDAGSWLGPDQPF